MGISVAKELFTILHLVLLVLGYLKIFKSTNYGRALLVKF
jgi:hypothetical protein